MVSKFIKIGVNQISSHSPRPVKYIKSRNDLVTRTMTTRVGGEKRKESKLDIKINLTEDDLKNLIKKHIESVIDFEVSIKEVSILVKSKQNYKSEWEIADFKAEYSYNKFK